MRDLFHRHRGRLGACLVAASLVACGIAPQHTAYSNDSFSYSRPWQVEAARKAWVSESLKKLESSGTFSAERQWLLDAIALGELDRTEATKSCQRVELLSIEPLPRKPRTIAVDGGSPRTLKPAWYSENWLLDVCGTRRRIHVLDDAGELNFVRSAQSPTDGPMPPALWREVWFGILRNLPPLDVRLNQAGHSRGTMGVLPDDELDRQTDRIAAKPGVVIGVGFQVERTSKRSAVPYEAVWQFPRELGPEPGNRSSEHRAKATCVVGAVCVQSWKFDSAWKVAPGRWTVQIYLDGQLAGSRSFDVSVE